MVLEKIVNHTRIRIEQAKKDLPLPILRATALRTPKKEPNRFKRSLELPVLSFICEVKRASPSKGIISEDFNYLQIAKEYEAAGAAAISILTEPEFFCGSSEYLTAIANAVEIPVLRKDFLLDEYQIYESAVMGADAILLICALLDTETLRGYIDLADSLGMDALVESHSAEEVESALAAGARIIGVNNRNLHTFEVDLQTSLSLRELVPPEIHFISESGIRTSEDISNLRKAGVNGVLIGETLMRSADKRAVLNDLRGYSYGKS